MPAEPAEKRLKEICSIYKVEILSLWISIFICSVPSWPFLLAPPTHLHVQGLRLPIWSCAVSAHNLRHWPCGEPLTFVKVTFFIYLVCAVCAPAVRWRSEDNLGKWLSASAHSPGIRLRLCVMTPGPSHKSHLDVCFFCSDFCLVWNALVCYGVTNHSLSL